MDYWHGYFGIENINLNQDQKQSLIDTLKTLGPQSNPQPCKLNHWRVRLDGEAVIFEALFNEEMLTISQFKQWLGIIFAVDPDTIDHVVNNQSFAGGITPVAVFSRNSIDYLRMALFGGLAATWMESGDECRGYLMQYSELWEGD